MKNCTPLTNFISAINNTHKHKIKDIDVVMPMYNLIECCNNCSKTSGNLDVPNDDQITDPGFFKFKANITGSTLDNHGTEDFETAVSLKYSSNFSRTFETPLFPYEINLILIWSEDCVISDTHGVKYVITNTNLFTLVVTLSTQDNAKLLEQLKSGFTTIFTTHKYNKTNMRATRFYSSRL